MTGYFRAAPRTPHAADAEPMRSLVWAALGVTPYVDRAIELLAAAERGDPESRALIVERDGTVVALALFGPIAGTANTWRLPSVIVAPQVDLVEVGRTLIDAVVAQVRAAGGRLLVADVADDAVLGRCITLLQASGFQEDGRVRDFFRAGVALVVLRRDLEPAPR